MTDGSDVTVSVLVTTYNLQDNVRQTLDSLLCQEVSFPYEILVGDDGSSDGTVEVVSEYCRKTDGLLRLYTMPRDEDDASPPVVRASRNRINLARHAKGKYLLFLDGDDYFVNVYALQSRVDVLEDPRNRDCVACGSNFNFYYGQDESRVPVVKRRIVRRKIDGKTYWRSGLWLPAEAFLFRNVIDFGSLEGERVSEDLFDDNLIVFAYLKYGNLCYIDSLDLDYRQNEGGFYARIAELAPEWRALIVDGDSSAYYAELEKTQPAKDSLKMLTDIKMAECFKKITYK